MKSTLDLAMDALTNFFNQVGAFVPKLIGALVILIIGYFIARSLRWTAQKALGFLKVDTLFERSGVNNLLAKTGMNLSGTKFIADVIYWVIMLVVWVAFFNAMGLEVISSLINQVIVFMPNLILACRQFLNAFSTSEKFFCNSSSSSSFFFSSFFALLTKKFVSLNNKSIPTLIISAK